MSLFQFGFSISSTRQQTPHAPENIALAASHLPDKEDTILGRNEYNQVAAAVVDLARPQPSQSRSKRSKYSGTLLIRPPTGQNKVVVLTGWSY